jgi:hypothetical protein
VAILLAGWRGDNRVNPTNAPPRRSPPWESPGHSLSAGDTAGVRARGLHGRDGAPENRNVGVVTDAGATMEPFISGYGIIDDAPLVHTWRVAQLTRLGIPTSMAEAYADRIDWHQVARLVQRGCPARLALRIVG